MSNQALYGKILESRIFPSQEEANKWAKDTKNQYSNAGETIKWDVVPADPTRRRWKAIIYLKV